MDAMDTGVYSPESFKNFMNIFSSHEQKYASYLSKEGNYDITNTHCGRDAIA